MMLANNIFKYFKPIKNFDYKRIRIKLIGSAY
jgi:hypothetical protein